MIRMTTEPAPTSTTTDRLSVRIAFLHIGAAVGALANSVAGSAAGLLAVRLGGEAWFAGWPQAMLVIGTALAALAISRASRRGGRSRALAAGAALAAIGAAVVVWSATAVAIGPMLLGSLVFGAGNAAVMLSRYAAAERATTGHRVRALTRLLVATSVGAVIGPLLLAPSDVAWQAMGLPPLAGCFALGAIGFAAAACAFVASTPRVPGSPRSTIPPAGEAGPVLGTTPADGGRVTGGGRTTRRDTILGVGILSLANIVMVIVMTVMPVHLEHLHADLGTVGLLISAHVAAMFAPSPLSGRLVARWGAERVAAVSALALGAASLMAASVPHSLPGVAASVVVIGAGWNLALVAGSAVLARDAAERVRLRREGWGEVGMGLAAAGGGAASGVLLQAAGFASVAATAGLFAAALVAAAATGAARSRPAGRP